MDSQQQNDRESKPAGPGSGKLVPDYFSAATHTARTWAVSLGLLATLVLLMFGEVLFSRKPVVLSSADGDLFYQFIHWRAFGFTELGHGNLALWNPHLFSGAPFFGGFQSALLYPPNFLFLCLPLAQAVNWSIALHVFLAGSFTYGWAAKRGLRPVACVLAGVVFMFGGAYFPHIYAGHLPNLCGMVWAPLLFLAIDGLFETSAMGWALLGMFALAMQVLAGHPQYVFYTGLAAALYAALLFFTVKKRKEFLIGLGGIVAGGVALSAVQLFTGLGESGEMLRSAGLKFELAAKFSFPPENFLTLLLPDLFGDLKTAPYWGRCYLWEMSLFVGTTGFVLAAAGAAWGARTVRRFSGVMIALLLLLALGNHTPLFKALYAMVPGFDKFRGSSKFIFLASLFIAMLSGIGFNELLLRRTLSRIFIRVVAGSGVLLLVAAFFVHRPGEGENVAGWWHSVMLAVRGTGEVYQPQASGPTDPKFEAGAARMAARSLMLGGGSLVLVAILLAAARRFRFAAVALLVFAVVELFVFGRKSLDTFEFERVNKPSVESFLAAHPGDYRILNLMPDRPNLALGLGAQDVWGYDPGVMRRYAELLAAMEGQNPDDAENLMVQVNPFPHFHRLFGMFRCRFAFVVRDGNLVVEEHTNTLPHVLLVPRWRVVTGRETMLAALTDPAFDFRDEVILETSPMIEAADLPDRGVVRLISSSSDSLTVEADVKSPCVMLVTDTYAEGWRAAALPGSAQSSYRVMPANHCLRGVPLTVGHHSVRLEYAPPGFLTGKWVSLISLCGFLMLAGRCGWQLKRRHRQST